MLIKADLDLEKNWLFRNEAGKNAHKIKHPIAEEKGLTNLFLKRPKTLCNPPFNGA